MKRLPQRIKDKIYVNGDCWLWTGCKIYNGYGRAKSKGKAVFAHRLSYEIYNKEIPKGMLVLHKCDVRNCINPDHLFLGTHQDNYDDMVEKGREVKATGKAHGRETKPHRTARGERTGTSKLKKEQVEEIIRTYKRSPVGGGFDRSKHDFSIRGLAKKYNVGSSTIQRIIKKEAWTSVRGED